MSLNVTKFRKTYTYTLHDIENRVFYLQILTGSICFSWTPKIFWWICKYLKIYRRKVRNRNNNNWCRPFSHLAGLPHTNMLCYLHLINLFVYYWIIFINKHHYHWYFKHHLVFIRISIVLMMQIIGNENHCIESCCMHTKRKSLFLFLLPDNSDWPFSWKFLQLKRSAI
jgi:hypothetical protein